MERVLHSLNCSKEFNRKRAKNVRRFVFECIKGKMGVGDMFVSELMSTGLAECTEDTRLEDAFELIRKYDHGMVVVVDSIAHRVPIGIVTERSICEQLITRGRNARSLTAGSVMDSRIKKVHSSERVEDLELR